MLYPSDILRFRCAPLEMIDTPRISALVDELSAILRRYGGVGLAAPQIGVPLPVFVFQHNWMLRHVVNPELQYGGLVSAQEEGCLSMPGMVGLVPRYERVVLSGLDMRGEPVQWELEGLSARIAQHEYDHLQGVLFLDRVVPGSLRSVRLDAGAVHERQY